MLKVQTLIINLQGFTDPPVWREIFFPLLKKGRKLLKHLVDVVSGNVAVILTDSVQETPCLDRENCPKNHVSLTGLFRTRFSLKASPNAKAL